MDNVEFKPFKPGSRALVVASACAGIVIGMGAMQATSSLSAAPSGTNVDALAVSAPQHDGTAPSVKPASSSSSQSARQCAVVTSIRTPAQRRSDRAARQLLPMSADAITEWLQGNRVSRTN